MGQIEIYFDLSSFKDIDSLNNVENIIGNESLLLGFRCSFTYDLIEKTAYCGLFYDLDPDSNSFYYGFALEFLNVIFEKLSGNDLLCYIQDIHIF